MASAIQKDCRGAAAKSVDARAGQDNSVGDGAWSLNALDVSVRGNLAVLQVYAPTGA